MDRLDRDKSGSTPQTDTYTWAEINTVFILQDTSTNNQTFAHITSGFGRFESGTAIVSTTTAPLPEPSSVVLTLTGMGLLVVMRKRKALGLAQAT